MTRVPDIGELADDLSEFRSELRLMREAMHRDFVPRDLHNEQIATIRGDIAGLRSSQAEGFAGLDRRFMWLVGLLGSIFVAIVVAAVTSAMRGAI